MRTIGLPCARRLARRMQEKQCEHCGSENMNDQVLRSLCHLVVCILAASTCPSGASQVPIARRVIMSVTSRPKVAVVHHDPKIIETVCPMLEAAGFEAIVCPANAYGYSCIRESRPRIILLDIQKDRFIGITLYHTLRHDRLSADIPIIFITEHVNRLGQLLPNYKRRGGIVLELPLDEHALIETVKTALTRQP